MVSVWREGGTIEWDGWWFARKGSRKRRRTRDRAALIIRPELGPAYTTPLQSYTLHWETSSRLVMWARNVKSDSTKIL